MATAEERIAELEERLRDMELEREERRSYNPFRLARDVAQEFVPSDVRRHMLAARRERLLAVRAYLDRAIARVEDAAVRITPNNATTD
jgi:hypothetical protein